MLVGVLASFLVPVLMCAGVIVRPWHTAQYEAGSCGVTRFAPSLGAAYPGQMAGDAFVQVHLIPVKNELFATEGPYRVSVIVYAPPGHPTMLRVSSVSVDSPSFHAGTIRVTPDNPVEIPVRSIMQQGRVLDPGADYSVGYAFVPGVYDLDPGNGEVVTVTLDVVYVKDEQEHRAEIKVELGPHTESGWIQLPLVT